MHRPGKRRLKKLWSEGEKIREPTEDKLVVTASARRSASGGKYSAQKKGHIAEEPKEKKNMGGESY